MKYVVAGIAPVCSRPPAAAAICAAVAPPGYSVSSGARLGELSAKTACGEVIMPVYSTFQNVVLTRKPGTCGGVRYRPTDQDLPVSALSLSLGPVSAMPVTVGLLMTQVGVAAVQPGRPM